MSKERAIRVVDKRKRANRNYAGLLQEFLTSWRLYHDEARTPHTVVLSDGADGGTDVKGDPDDMEDVFFNSSFEVTWWRERKEAAGEKEEPSLPEES